MQLYQKQQQRNSSSINDLPSSSSFHVVRIGENVNWSAVAGHAAAVSLCQIRNEIIIFWRNPLSIKCDKT